MSHAPLRFWAIDLYEEVKLKMLGFAHHMAWWSLLGLLSSACCVLQIILNLFSFGCAGFNTLLGPVRPPLIAECPISIECRVLSIQEVGDHDLFLGEAVAEHVAEEALDHEGKVIVEKTDAICYLHGEYWTCGERLARHGFTRGNS